jgi:hypothetical protein
MEDLYQNRGSLEISGFVCDGCVGGDGMQIKGREGEAWCVCSVLDADSVWNDRLTHGFLRRCNVHTTVYG